MLPCPRSSGAFALGLLFIVAAVVLVAAPRPAQPTASRMAPARSVRRATLRAQQVEPHAHGTEVGRPPVAESTMKPRTPEERRRATERERQRLAKMTPEQRRQRRTLPSPEQRREYQRGIRWADLTPKNASTSAGGSARTPSSGASGHSSGRQGRPSSGGALGEGSRSLPATRPIPHTVRACSHASAGAGVCPNSSASGSARSYARFWQPTVRP